MRLTSAGLAAVAVLDLGPEAAPQQELPNLLPGFDGDIFRERRGRDRAAR